MDSEKTSDFRASFINKGGSSKEIACLRIDPPLEENAFLGLAEASLRFSPQMALRKNGAIFLEVGGSHHLFNEQGLRARWTLLARRWISEERWSSTRIRVAVAPYALHSWLLASFTEDASAPNRLAGPTSIPSDSASQAKDSWLEILALPIQTLVECVDFFETLSYDERAQRRRQVREQVRVLERLGLRTLGDFLRLPRETLASRWGIEGVRLAGLLRGDWEPAWPGYRLPEKWIEKSDLSSEFSENGALLKSVDAVQGLLLCAHPLIDRTMARLRAQCLRAETVRFRIELERWSTLSESEVTREWVFPLGVPQGTSRAILPILRDRLAWELERNPLLAPVQRLEWEVVSGVPGLGGQRDFFRTKSEERKERWESLVGRLMQRLGKDHVYSAQLADSHVPERAWSRVAPTLPPHLRDRLDPHLMESPDPRGERKIPLAPIRPTRLLREVLPLVRTGDTLRLASSVRVGARTSWEIESWNGPERIETQWWERGAVVQRDYYSVRTRTGEWLWIYQEHTNKGYYLHGLFD